MDDHPPTLTADHLVRALDESGRFHRDTGIGAIYHRGKVSFRELSPTNSLHVVVSGNRLSAHVDHISPLKRRRDGTIRYSWVRAVAHNITGMSADLTRLARGRQIPNRCNLECQLVWVDDESPPTAGDDG